MQYTALQENKGVGKLIPKLIIDNLKDMTLSELKVLFKARQEVATHISGKECRVHYMIEESGGAIRRVSMTCGFNFGPYLTSVTTSRRKGAECQTYMNKNREVQNLYHEDTRSLNHYPKIVKGGEELK